MAILLIMTGAFAIALVVYTKVIRNDMNMQLSLEVNKVVENYVSLTDHKLRNSTQNQEAI